MIKVEQRPNDNSVALAFDEKGGLALIDAIKAMIDAGKTDHFHVTDFLPPEGFDMAKCPDKSLSLTPLSDHPDAQVVSLLTVLFLAAELQDPAD